MMYPEIAKELAVMTKQDQEMRKKSHEIEGFWDWDIDRQHTAKVKEIVSKIGWPTISKVGPAGAEQAWLLVQHADKAVDFQKSCLKLMESEPPHEVRRDLIALLTDRICINERRKQVYGTQFNQINGKHVPLPIENPDHVDERRISMGLDTLEEGIAEMYKKYPKG